LRFKQEITIVPSDEDGPPAAAAAQNKTKGALRAKSSPGGAK